MKPIWTKSISPLGLGLGLALVCLWSVGWQLVSSAISPAAPA